MRILRPSAVYISDRVRADARCIARMERMMTRIECDNVRDVDDDDMRSRPPEVQGKLYGPLSHERRKEIYRFCIGEIRSIDPDVPVSLCLESSEMWDEFESDLGIRREAYPCCCGPQCVPGNRIMTPNATRSQEIPQ